MIRTRLALSVLACVGVAGTGCASAPMTSSPAVNWQNHETIRTCIGDPDAFKGGPMPVCHGYQRPSEVPVPVTDVHYVTIQLERIYFRDLPEWTRDADVSISVSVKGLLPGGREYRRVLDIAHVKKEAFLQLQNVSINFPMKYENRVTSLEFRIEEIDDIKAARKWFDAGKKLLKGVQSSPLAGGLMGALLISEITEDVATVVLDQLSQNDHVFALEQVDFLPVTATTDPNPQLLFTPGRFMVVAVPPTDAYPQMHSLYPGTYPSLLDRRWLMEHTQYDGGKLTMKDGGGSYLFTPYVSFNFAILKRYAEVNPAVSHFK